MGFNTETTEIAGTTMASTTLNSNTKGNMFNNKLEYVSNYATHTAHPTFSIVMTRTLKLKEYLKIQQVEKFRTYLDYEETDKKKYISVEDIKKVCVNTYLDFLDERQLCILPLNSIELLHFDIFWICLNIFLAVIKMKQKPLFLLVYATKSVTFTGQTTKTNRKLKVLGHK